MSDYIVSIVEHKNSGSVGIAALSLISPKLYLVQLRDNALFNETIAQLYAFIPFSTALICASNEGSLLNAKLRRHFPHADVVALPRKEFSENAGAALLRTLALPASDVAVGANFFLSTAAAAAVLRYAEASDQCFAPGTLCVVQSGGEGHVSIDPATVARLELVSNGATGSARRGTLLGRLGYTKTKIGARLLAANIVRPFTDVKTIVERLEAVDEILGSEDRFFAVVDFVKKVALAGVDFEQVARTITTTDGGSNDSNDNSPIRKVRIKSSNISKSCNSSSSSSSSSQKRVGESQLKKVVALHEALGCLDAAAGRALGGCKSVLLVRIRENLLCPALRSVRSEIESVISVSSSGSDGRKKRRYGRAELGFAVKDGVDPFLDVARAECVETIEDISKLVTEYRSIVPGVSLRRNERAKKYYLEVSTTSCSEDPAKLAPTLFVDSAYAHSTAKTKGSSNSSNGRWTFTTRAVESLSRKNADAMERVITFSARVVDALLGRIRGTAVIPLVLAGEALAHLDLLQAFATYATLNSPTVRPEFTPDGPIAIKQGRHPVLDGDSSGSDGGSNGGGGSSSCSCSGFVPNDTFLGPSGVQVVTGPNMSGKSTYIRQVALLTIMAHMGCHVPAEFASFRVVDRIMSRVAAPVSDPDSDGTDGSFAAELRGVRSVLLATEAPNVSLSSSSSSTTFVIVDEFGRSTAPLGGRSLAWAVAERLSRSPGVLCLFVTHFCDVAAGLEAAYPALVTARHFAVERCAGNAFRPLFALTAGVSQDTLGVETAAACGLPQRYVLDIAKEFRGELKAMREAERAKRVSTTTTAAVSEGLGCEGNLTQSQVLLAKRLLSLKNSTLGLADMQKLLESIKSSI